PLPQCLKDSLLLLNSNQNRRFLHRVNRRLDKLLRSKIQQAHPLPHLLHSLPLHSKLPPARNLHQGCRVYSPASRLLFSSPLLSTYNPSLFLSLNLKLLNNKMQLSCNAPSPNNSNDNLRSNLKPDLKLPPPISNLKCKLEHTWAWPQTRISSVRTKFRHPSRRFRPLLRRR